MGSWKLTLFLSDLVALLFVNAYLKIQKHSLHIGEEANRGVSLGSSLRNKAKGGMRNYGGTYVPVRE